MHFVTLLYVLLFGIVIKEAVKHANAYINTLGGRKSALTNPRTSSPYLLLLPPPQVRQSDNQLHIIEGQEPCFCERSFRSQLQGTVGRQHFRLSSGVQKQAKLLPAAHFSPSQHNGRSVCWACCCPFDANPSVTRRPSGSLGDQPFDFASSTKREARAWWRPGARLFLQTCWHHPSAIARLGPSIAGIISVTRIICSLWDVHSYWRSLLLACRL